MYYYEFKTLGVEKNIIIYQENKVIYTSNLSKSDKDELFKEALLYLEKTYTDIRSNIKPRLLQSTLPIRPEDRTFNVGTYRELSYQGVIDIVYAHLQIIDSQGYSTLWSEFNELRDSYWNFENPPTINGSIPILPTWEEGVQYRQNIMNKANKILSLSSAPSNFKAPDISNLPESSDTGSTKDATFNNPPGLDGMKGKKKELQDKINQLQQIGLPSSKDLGKQIWENMIKPKLLTHKQIAKKILIMQGSTMNPPLSEEDAQLIVYGKVHYKNGKLFDNDLEDPSCVSQPTDDDYEPPLDENHPLWQKIENMLKDVKDGLMQLGIKLGEFIFAQPQAIAVIATSLVSLVSSIVILPFGAGIPTALSAVQTMMNTIKSLQQKTAEILPLLGIIDIIGLILPKDAQAVIAQINIIIGIYMGILTAITAILGLLDAVVSALGKAKKKMESIRLEIEPKAEPSVVTLNNKTKLSANAKGSDWNFTYEWRDINGNIIPKDADADDDDGTRTIIPEIQIVYNFPPIPPMTKYFVKVTDGKGNVKEGDVIVTRG